ncbi:MAG: NAD-dependent epimerase/dehydratase family protein [Ignavibacteriales bacterium]
MTFNTCDLSQYRILVTGAGGFIGSELTKWLLEQGALVVGNDTVWSKTAVCLEQKRWLKVDGGFAEKIDEIDRCLFSADRDKTGVIHLAGMANASDCEQIPYAAFNQNVHLTVKVLEYCRKRDIDKIVYPSTGYVYGDQLTHPANEEDSAHPSGFYTITKLSAEAMIQGYLRLFNMVGVIARLSNVYGAESNIGTVAGLIMGQVNMQKEISVQSFTPVRDFIFIKDAVEGLGRLLKQVEIPGCHIVNLSTGIGTSVLELAETICDASGYSRERIKQLEGTGNSAYSRLVLDNGKLGYLTGWTPKYNLRDGMLTIMKGSNKDA